MLLKPLPSSAGLAAIVVLLTSCASTPTAPPVSDAAQPAKAEAAEVELVVEPPTRPFSTETLYALLVAEMAFDRKRYDITLGNYVQQAKNTQDPKIAAHATHVARGLNARKSALEMSQLWLSLQPESPDARLIAAVELIEGNHLLEAFDLSKQMLMDGETPAFDSLAMKAENGDISIVKTLLPQFASLLENYKDNAGLWLGHSILALKTGQHEAALESAKRARKLDDDGIRGAFQETRVLHKMGRTQDANALLAELVDENPNNIGLRARYARLIWSTSPETAREQFEILHRRAPGDAEILYSLALVEKDLGNLEPAKAHFEKLLARSQYTGASHYHLGEILETQKELEKALNHLQAVEPGEYYSRAMARASDLLVGQGRPDDAFAMLANQKGVATGDNLQGLYLIEADLLSEAGQIESAEQVLTQGIDEFPNSTSLLYSRALMYAQHDKISQAEQDFKRVLKLVPESPEALNALGYTLVDRTDRLEEAKAYIEKAYSMAPDNAAIIDSMGWLAFKMGEHERALQFLREAMEAQPDHEIAAHLGEVLWVLGRQDEAIATWKKGLELKPESQVIANTLRRLEAKVD